MALSGTIYSNVGSRHRIQLEWTATQNASANTSTVTARLYWIALDQYGAIYSSSSDPASITVNGSTSSTSATGALSGNQKKLIHTKVTTIDHNSDGTKTFNLSASFTVNVTFSGNWIGTVSTSGSGTLNTIPRESTLSAAPTFTAGNNFTVSVNRASSSFRHEAVFYVKDAAGNYGSSIATFALSTSQTSVSSAFTVAENTAIFNKLDGAASRGTRVILKTYSGSTLIGETTRDGTVTAPTNSNITSGYDAYRYTDEDMSFGITRANSSFTHTVRFKLGTYTKTITGATTSVSWEPTSGEQNSLHAQMPNDVYKDGSIEIDTFYNGVQVRGTRSHLLQFHVRNANPIFTGTITYADTNSTTTTLTGNNQFIIQGKSILSVTLSAASVTAQKGATISGFTFMVSGKSATNPYTTSAITKNFSTINSSTNQTIVVEAVDSRGNKATISKIVTVIPYTPPTLSTSAARVNGFEATTTLKASGLFSRLMVGGVPKNDILNLRYRTKLKTSSTWGSYTSFSVGTSLGTFTGTDRTISIPITSAYDIEFSVSDRLSTTTALKSVGVGRPIFFIDDVLGSISMNDFPVDPNTFLLNGRLTFAGNLYASGVEGQTGGAIDVNNGDIVGANAIWWNDPTGNQGEGLLFPRSATPNKSGDASLYDNFYIRDGEFFLNNYGFMRWAEGDSAGKFVGFGAGGTTVVGGGESVARVLNDSGIPNANERMIVANDSYVNIISNLQSSWASGQTWTFNNDGIMYRPTYKEGNGFQTTTVRINPNHTDPMLIQEVNGTVSLATSAATGTLNISWPVAFDVAPQWVIVGGRESNSAHASFAAYNITTTGCTVYATRLPSTGSGAYGTGFVAVACGRKG